MWLSYNMSWKVLLMTRRERVLVAGSSFKTEGGEFLYNACFSHAFTLCPCSPQKEQIAWGQFRDQCPFWLQRKQAITVVCTLRSDRL
jgi:hypothetical protein